MTVICDHGTITRAAVTFIDFERRLPAEVIVAIDALLRVLPIDPRTADAETAWSVIWNKPLYANTKVSVGDRWIAQLGPHMTGAWERWGADRAVFHIEKSRETSFQRGRKIDVFSLAGVEGLAVRGVTTASIHRLYAIQNAACALRARAGQVKFPVSAFWDTPLCRLIGTLKAEFGWGWGPTTVVHMCTDFGVAIKTDRHVLRCLRRLKIWRSDRDFASLVEVVALNEAVRKLCAALGEVSPQSLRRLDFRLMKISQYLLRD